MVNNFGIGITKPSHNWGGFFAFGNMEKNIKTNATDFPKFYFVRHMQAGLCGYEDETILVDNDAMRRLGETFNGKPVYIDHRDVDLDTMKADAVGYVTDTWIDGNDGWLWSKIMVTDDEAHEVLANGWAVSNAYIPTEWGDGGLKHNLPYDRRVINGEFTHLALVDNPRYEDAKVYTPSQYEARNNQLMNSLASKPTEEKKGFIMKFFKNKKEEVSNASDADTLEYTNAKGETVEVAVSEMVNAIENAQKQERTVKVNGKEMKLSDVVKAYEALNAKKGKKNEDDEDEMENESDEDEKENMSDEDDYENESDEEMENEDDEDEKEAAKGKKNSKDHFKTLSNASKRNSFQPITIDTTAAKLARAAKYGSK